MNDRATILSDILKELDRAEKLHPAWPTDIVHAAAIMAEEAGESVQSALNAHYHGGSIAKVRMELVQTAAMCVRMIQHLTPCWCGEPVYYGSGDHDHVPCTEPRGHDGYCSHDGNVAYAAGYGMEEE